MIVEQVVSLLKKDDQNQMELRNIAPNLWMAEPVKNGVLQKETPEFDPVFDDERRNYSS